MKRPVQKWENFVRGICDAKREVIIIFINQKVILIINN